MTNTDETYNGWANRETWAFNMHWQNDQGLYETVKEWARELFSPLATDTEPNDYALGEYIIEQAREFWAEYREQGPYTSGDGQGLSDNPVLMWERETGSVWRVDATEVGEAVREALDNG